MLFNSFPFLLFFLSVILLFFSLPFKYRKFLLLVASYFFYMLWKPSYGVLIAFSTVLSYFTAILIAKYPFEKRKRYIWLSLFVNLGVLFFFKYFNFFNENMRIAFTYFQLDYPIPDMVKVVLPVGISFYTFETISYVLDVYYDRREPEKDLSTYALYISFFPKLLAGPIERSMGLLPQLHAKTTIDYNRITEGLRRMLWGFFKKIVIADRLASLIDPVYTHPDHYSGLYVLSMCYLFAFQIYCDFSGYTDIAIGASKILGYDVVENFDRPYISKTVGEFWRRWHISLSCWLKDYLFTPIVFKRKNWGNWALVYATFITFILCGLWHGAKWTFVIFGLLQGIVISYELIFKKMRKKLSQQMNGKVYNGMSWLLTFNFVVFSFIFFRADSMHNAFEVINRITSMFDVSSFRGIFPLAFHKFDFMIAVFSILIVEYIQFIQSKGLTMEKWHKKPAYVRWTCYYLILITIITLGVFEESQFIYYQF
jgi:alginate O-acetyltransferase complex protein AlgI